MQRIEWTYFCRTVLWLSQASCRIFGPLIAWDNEKGNQVSSGNSSWRNWSNVRLCFLNILFWLRDCFTGLWEDDRAFRRCLGFAMARLLLAYWRSMETVAEFRLRFEKHAWVSYGSVSREKQRYTKADALVCGCKVGSGSYHNQIYGGMRMCIQWEFRSVCRVLSCRGIPNGSRCKFSAWASEYSLLLSCRGPDVNRRVECKDWSGIVHKAENHEASVSQIRRNWDERGKQVSHRQCLFMDMDRSYGERLTPLLDLCMCTRLKLYFSSYSPRVARRKHKLLFY